MKIAQLEYFCAVCRYHSITQAAEKLYVTQPAISSAIKELEKEFSINLFVRSKNHITLTKEGELFYQKATKLLDTISQTSSELYDLGRQISPIRIGIPPLLSTIFFPDMLISFQQKYPDIPVQLFEYGSIRAANLVLDDVLDLALINMNLYEIDKMNSHQLLSEQIVFCVSPTHHLAIENELSIEMIKDENLIMYNTDSVLNTTLYSRFESLGIKPNVIMYASQLFTIQSLINHDFGGAFLYSSLMKNLPGLIGIPSVPIINQEIGLVWKKGKYVNDSVKKFISFIKTL